MKLAERVYLIPCALVLLHILVLPLRVNHDASQYLVAGHILVDGGLPHIDAIDTNPPLIMLLSALPVLLARLVPLDAATIFNLLVLAALLGSCRALGRLLRSPELELDGRDRAIVLAVWASATLSIDVNNQLGQRDHLFMLAFVPFAVLRWLRWRGQGPAAPRALAIGLGFATGLMAAFRPSLGALVVLPELVYLVRHRRARTLLLPETVAAAAALAAYAAYFLLQPAVREAYFGRWVPFLATGYATFDSPLGARLGVRALWFALAGAALPLVLVDAARPFAARGFWRLARALAALTVLAALLYVQGGKDWNYRLHPTFGCAALVVGLALAALLRQIAPAPAWRTPVAAVVAACVVLLGAWQPRTFMHLGSIDETVERMVVDIERNSRPGDPILVFGTGVTPAHPALLMTGRRPATRYLNLFPIPILHARPDAAAEQRFLDELRHDVAAHPPAIIFVMRALNSGVPARFDLAQYLEDKGLLPWLRDYYPVDLDEDAFATYVRASR